MPSLAMDITNHAGALAEQFDALIEKATEEQAKATKNKVKASIQNHGLIKTGRMLASVDAQRIGKHQWRVAVMAVSKKGFPYPAIQNSGGRYIKATHFFDEPRVEAEEDYPDAMIRAVRSALG